MDPFNEVKDDAWVTIHNLEDIVRRKQANTSNIDINNDYNNNYLELQEIYQDLQQAVEISEKQPQKFQLKPQDILVRKQTLEEIKEKIKEIEDEWKNLHNHTPREITTMSNRISQDSNAENPFEQSSMNQFQQQELIQEQDIQLDSIHDTMRNLNQQAAMMGNELEEQGYMLDQFEDELDNVDNKLSRGVKRINRFIEQNKDRGSDWCIGILVVALCILLILVIAI